jgi:glucose-6-phosphate 1-dehydrogenase
VFKSVPPLDADHYVRGQYEGYRDVPGVKPDSDTETFAALRLDIENQRWSGVPFFIRAGKALPRQATEVRIVFKAAPRLVIADREVPEVDELILRIDPEPGADLVVQAKQPGAESTRTVDLSLVFSEQLGALPEPYERLLLDALHGEVRLFAREDAVEETWRIVQPLLDSPSPIESYRVGSWGPNAADQVVSGFPKWREPWL